MIERSQHITVFIIDSNVLMRRILSNILQQEKGVILSGFTGEYGFESVSSKIKLQRPDLLFLGIERADSEKMDLFYQLRHAFPELHIVLLTNLNREGAAIALQGLNNGAIDYVTKPENARGMILAGRHFHKRVTASLFVTKRKKRSGNDFTDEGKVIKNQLKDIGRMNPGRIELIVIGSSLGGVPSLYEVVSTLPKSLSIPVVIVQHMPKIYTEVLAGELDKITSLPVTEAKNGSLLTPKKVYVAPGGYHSVIKSEGGQKRITLHKGPREHKCRPSIDVLLRSAVQEYGEKILSVFLSAGGSDGLLGALRVLESGGIMLVESPESALVSDLGQKVKYLNSKIQEVSADVISEEIMSILQPAVPKREYFFQKTR